MISKPNDITDSSEYSNTKYLILWIFLKNCSDVTTNFDNLSNKILHMHQSLKYKTTASACWLITNCLGENTWSWKESRIWGVCISTHEPPVCCISCTFYLRCKLQTQLCVLLYCDKAKEHLSEEDHWMWLITYAKELQENGYT